MSTPETTRDELKAECGARATVPALKLELAIHSGTDDRVELCTARISFALAVNLGVSSRSQCAAFIVRAFFREFSRATKASATRSRRRIGLAAYRLRVRERRRAPPLAVASVKVLPTTIDAQTGTPRPVPRLVMNRLRGIHRGGLSPVLTLFATWVATA